MVDAAELALFRAIASFSSKAALSFKQSKAEADNLRTSTEQMLIIYRAQGVQIPCGVSNVIVSTINSALESDRQSKRPPQITGEGLHLLYRTVELLRSHGVASSVRLDYRWFNEKTNNIFLFPGQPRIPGWEFVHGKFAFLGNQPPKHTVSLEYLQHVVHDLDTLLTMLRTVSGKVHFKGFLNDDFHGYPLCWFAPVAPARLNKSTPPCDSLDPNGSRYGCFRFTVPSYVLLQRFPTCFILGTRKYYKEHCHTILLADSGIRSVTLGDKVLPVKLTDTSLIQHSFKPPANSTHSWLCYHDDRSKKWDQLEFAVATKELLFDPNADNIRLDFVDHSCKICVPSFKTHSKCQHAWDKPAAMRNFLTKLDENNIDFDGLMNLFSDDVWNELLLEKDSLRAKRLKTRIETSVLS